MAGFLSCSFEDFRDGAVTHAAFFCTINQRAKLVNRGFPAFLVAANEIAEILADVAIAAGADLGLYPLIHLGGHRDGQSRYGELLFMRVRIYVGFFNHNVLLARRCPRTAELRALGATKPERGIPCGNPGEARGPDDHGFRSLVLLLCLRSIAGKISND